MNKKDSSKLGAPTVEIIISIGILAFCSAVIVGVFLSANSLQKKSSDLLTANLKAQTEAELVLKNPAKYVSDAGKFELIRNGDGSLTVLKYFDIDWNPVSGKAEFVMTVNVSEQKTKSGVMTVGRIEVTKNSKYPFLKNSDSALVCFDVKGYDNE